MRFSFLSVLFLTVALTACGTTMDQTSSTMGSGGGMAGDQNAQGRVNRADVRPGSNDDFVLNVGDRVFFDFDRYNLSSEAKATLDRQAAWLKRYNAMNILIEGHADERGTREYNLALGERRANAVKDYLVSQGIAGNRLDVISYGKERPAVVGSNEASWAQNRRSVTVVRDNRLSS